MTGIRCKTKGEDKPKIGIDWEEKLSYNREDRALAHRMYTAVTRAFETIDEVIQTLELAQGSIPNPEYDGNALREQKEALKSKLADYIVECDFTRYRFRHFRKFCEQHRIMYDVAPDETVTMTLGSGKLIFPPGSPLGEIYSAAEKLAGNKEK